MTQTDLRLSGIRILLIEDGKDNQTIFQYVLEKAGANVSIAENGRDGIAQASQGGFDLVLMDIQMPEMDGYEATRILKGAGFTKPIIALTAHAMNTEREKCLRSGFDDYVSKPVEFSTLIDIIAKHAQFPVPSSKTHQPVTETRNSELIDRFRAEHAKELSSRLAESVIRMQQACNCQQWHELAKVAHKVKGTCAVYGLREMAATASEIETLATSGRTIAANFLTPLKKLEQYSRQI